MSFEMLFLDCDGVPAPTIEVDEGGEVLAADGVNVRTLDQAAAFYAMTPDHLAKLWVLVHKRYLSAQAREDKPPGAASTEAELARERRALAVLRHQHYRGWSDEDFEFFVTKCAKLGLCPWRGQVYPVWRNGVLDVEITVAAARGIAMRTGEYLGYRDVKFRRVPGSTEIASASTVIYRKVNGERQRFPIRVYMAERHPGPGVDRFWDEMPRTMLWKCLIMAGLREAFAAELNGLYCSEETRQRPQRRPVRPPPTITGGTAAVAAPRPRTIVGDRRQQMWGESETRGMTYFQFKEELTRLGLVTEDQQVEAIRKLRSRFPAFCDADAPRFYAEALAEVRRSPGQYGAKVD